MGRRAWRALVALAILLAIGTIWSPKVHAGGPGVGQTVQVAKGRLIPAYTWNGAEWETLSVSHPTKLTITEVRSDGWTIAKCQLPGTSRGTVEYKTVWIKASYLAWGANMVVLLTSATVHGPEQTIANRGYPVRGDFWTVPLQQGGNWSTLPLAGTKVVLPVSWNGTTVKVGDRVLAPNQHTAYIHYSSLYPEGYGQYTIKYAVVTKEVTTWVGRVCWVQRYGRWIRQWVRVPVTKTVTQRQLLITCDGPAA